MKILIPIIAAFLFTISGCYYDSQEFLYPQLNTTCDTTNVTFALSVKPILENSCLGCHSNNSAPSSGGSIKLQDYADVKFNESKLIGSVKHSSGFSPMPKGSSKLEPCKITIIEKWINSGSLNN